ncbi:MAG: ORF6N domain-containing protein [Burkholderiales bacterium]
MPKITQIQIANSTISVVEYRGKRVVTFAMIDQVHGRPNGTAGRNFRENRNRFISEADFYDIDSNSLDEFRRDGIFGESAHRGTLITQAGYLMLAKSFTDDFAWQVQRELVNTYFNVQQAIQSSPKKRGRPALPPLADRPSPLDAFLPIPYNRVRAALFEVLSVQKKSIRNHTEAMHAATRIVGRVMGIADMSIYLELPGLEQGAHTAPYQPFSAAPAEPLRLVHSSAPVTEAESPSERAGSGPHASPWMLFRGDYDLKAAPDHEFLEATQLAEKFGLYCKTVSNGNARALNQHIIRCCYAQHGSDGPVPTAKSEKLGLARRKPVANGCGRSFYVWHESLLDLLDQESRQGALI